VGAKSGVEAEVSERARRKQPLCPLLRRRRRLAELVGHGGEERFISPPSRMGIGQQILTNGGAPAFAVPRHAHEKRRRCWIGKSIKARAPRFAQWHRTIYLQLWDSPRVSLKWDLISDYSTLSYLIPIILKWDLISDYSCSTLSYLIPIIVCFYLFALESSIEGRSPALVLASGGRARREWGDHDERGSLRKRVD
jgi:hypothetical protein